METYVSQRRREGWVPVLTADLARSRTTDETITPLFIDPDEERYQQTARELIQLFEAHLGEPKGDLEDAIDELTIADTDYKIVQGLAKLLKDECEFEVVASVEPREIRRRLFEKANERYPIVRQPTLGEDTQKLEVYSAVADDLGVSLEECYRGMYADLEDNKRLVRIGTRTADQYASDDDTSTSTTNLTGSSDAEYEHTGLTVDWLVTRYNLALAQAVLYDATEMRIRVWDHFGTVFSYVKLFGLMHRIYPIDSDGERVANTDQAAGYEAVLDGPASLFSKSQKYGIRMANFLPALPSVTAGRWLVRSSSTRRPARPDSSRSTPRRISIHTTARATSSIATSSGRSPINGSERIRTGSWCGKTMSST